MPEAPTIAEPGIAGLAGFESTLTYGQLAPRGTPGARIKELAVQILRDAASALP